MLSARKLIRSMSRDATRIPKDTLSMEVRMGSAAGHSEGKNGQRDVLTAVKDRHQINMDDVVPEDQLEEATSPYKR